MVDEEKISALLQQEVENINPSSELWMHIRKQTAGKRSIGWAIFSRKFAAACLVILVISGIFLTNTSAIANYLGPKLFWIFGNRTILNSPDGENWAVVNPDSQPVKPQGMTAQFLDSTTAWVAEAKKDGSINLLHTTNGGLSWGSTNIPNMSNSPIVYSLSIDFVDSQNGWLMEELEHSMNSSAALLLRTKNGGKTWSKIATTNGQPSGLPFAGPIKFLNNSTGWIVGNRISTVNRLLFFTNDGGLTWQNQVPAAPANLLETGTIDFNQPPTFFSFEQGVLSATFVPNSHLAKDYGTVIFSTSDGGVTWSYNNYFRLGSLTSFVSPKVGWMWVREPRDTGSTTPVKGKIYLTNDGGKSWSSVVPDSTLQASLEKGKDIVEMKFVTDQFGWLMLSSENDQSPRFLVTNDGGHSWKTVNP